MDSAENVISHYCHVAVTGVAQQTPFLCSVERPLLSSGRCLQRHYLVTAGIYGCLLRGYGPAPGGYFTILAES
jgi:hypothetical protein